MKIDALLMDPQDNVVTCVRDVAAGETVAGEAIGGFVEFVLVPRIEDRNDAFAGKTERHKAFWFFGKSVAERIVEESFEELPLGGLWVLLSAELILLPCGDGDVKGSPILIFDAHARRNGKRVVAVQLALEKPVENIGGEERPFEREGLYRED